MDRPVPRFGQAVSPRAWTQNALERAKRAISGSRRKGGQRSVASLLNMIQKVDPAADFSRWHPSQVSSSVAAAMATGSGGVSMDTSNGGVQNPLHRAASNKSLTRVDPGDASNSPHRGHAELYSAVDSPVGSCLPLPGWLALADADSIGSGSAGSRLVGSSGGNLWI